VSYWSYFFYFKHLLWLERQICMRGNMKMLLLSFKEENSKLFSCPVKVCYIWFQLCYTLAALLPFYFFCSLYRLFYYSKKTLLSLVLSSIKAMFPLKIFIWNDFLSDLLNTTPFRCSTTLICHYLLIAQFQIWWHLTSSPQFTILLIYTSCSTFYLKKYWLGSFWRKGTNLHKS